MAINARFYCTRRKLWMGELRKDPMAVCKSIGKTGEIEKNGVNPGKTKKQRTKRDCEEI